jgi:hypothetical protein
MAGTRRGQEMMGEAEESLSSSRCLALAEGATKMTEEKKWASIFTHIHQGKWGRSELSFPSTCKLRMFNECSTNIQRY